MIKAIEVLMHGATVGALTWNEAKQMGEFQYTPEFIKTGLEISPLMMPLRETPYSFPELVRTKTFSGLPGLIADSLPEKFGNRLLGAWLQRQGRTFDSLSPLERLTYVGSRGMGALEYRPDLGDSAQAPTAISVTELVEVAQTVLQQRKDSSTQLSNDIDMEQMIQVGTSAGGAKAKAIIAWHPETNDVLSGQTEVPEGYQYWLLKFDEVDNEELATANQIGRIEMAYHYMAVEAGIDMMESRLMEDGNKAHFMTRRFDRGERGEKYHVQTFSSMTHQDRDPPGMIGYESLFATARKLSLPQDQVTQLYRRMVFNILARNQDDHAKNHAFIMDETGGWHLTPAYDICFSYKPGSEWIDQHQMRCNDKRDHFTRDDLLHAAKAADVKHPQEIIKEVQMALKLWPRLASEVGLLNKSSNSIQSLFRTV